MSADAVKSPGPAADHNVGGGGEAAGGDGSGADGASADHGGAGVAAIDDAEAFHLKTVRDIAVEWVAVGCLVFGTIQLL